MQAYDLYELIIDNCLQSEFFVFPELDRYHSTEMKTSNSNLDQKYFPIVVLYFHDFYGQHLQKPFQFLKSNQK